VCDGSWGSAIARESKILPQLQTVPLKPVANPMGPIARELGAFSLVALAAFSALSLVSLDLGRRPNLGGPIGYELAGSLHLGLGYQAYALVALTLALAQRIWSGARPVRLGREIGGGIILVVTLAIAAALWNGGTLAGGGMLGQFLATVLLAYLNLGGSYLVVIFALICALALMSGRAPTDLLASMFSAVPIPGRSGSTQPPADDQEPRRAPAIAVVGREIAANGHPDSAPPFVRRIAERLAPGKKTAQSAKPRSKGGWKLPALDLLESPPAEHAEIDEHLLEKGATVLEQKLGDFGVDGRVTEVQPGPVVTMYKFEPGSGIKVSQIVNLADDLSMALRAAAVRIQAPVPGEAVVGIEVPNRKRERVCLREIVEAQEFQTLAVQSQLTIALGKDIVGHPVAADLARMPHLLIAGATGTGKSVSIHTMIASILFNATADDVRFILIDPKMLELSVYENIPHLLVPVVVDPEKAAAALLWATQEMEDRYRMMRDLGVRNIDGYNKVLSGKAVVELKPVNQVSPPQDPSAPPAAPIEHRKLPKIVIVIDELADLLLSEGKTVERDITRLAQKARAAGIHLILATQRPSVDVITGLIKANLPARISLQVTSRVDSRTILDSIGAERLLGAGDMLFMPPGSAKLRRLHGPFVSEAEIRRVVDFLRAQGSPDYKMEILETKVPSEDESFADEKDEVYDEAVRIVMETNQASISMIQRRLRVGYNRAARMVERMEHEGLVSPPDGARPREVRLRGAR
jgi:S-DNA-T family DNA segregation ATPase FtsK/SpoIIIE